MLGRVADDRDDDHADEHFGKSKRTARRLDSADEELRNQGDESGRHQQNRDRFPF